MNEIAEATRRRTFAIISHPDAGKTTLTEKFLLYSGAVQEAGAVHAREGRRSARSDWMELEQQRGISISSTVMQFPYRDHIMNLLDTPGHRDFSEDTYRVLSAVDAVVMVLDAAKGIEAQTLKLFQVCRSRNLPVITFLNKYDRPGREPLELLDEIEQQIQLRPTPATWPVGSGEDFYGLIDRRTDLFTRFTRTARGASAAAEETTAVAAASVAGSSDHGPAWKAALDECSLLDAVGADVDLMSFLAGESTPVFVGSALTNFGVRLLLDAVIELAPSPSPRLDRDDQPRLLDSPFSAFVFKVQANMDPAHRDRIAFARICSGRFERGMSVTNHRTGRDLTTKYATTAFGPDRQTVDEAFPGDVVGLVNASGVQLGDTLFDAGYAGLSVEYPPIPRFSPEVFAKARPLDNGRFKQFRKGLAQLDEEGVVQVLRDPDFGESETILAAVGELQFEVFAYRLGSEFGAPTEILSAPYQAIRLTDKESSERLRQIGGIRILTRGDGALVALFENRYRLQRLESDEPELTLLPIVAG
ncbi:MAG TPA: peptide chain release factor 3 [Ilumatobacteraceae bacterium]|nr:peptide chain release factor 3 [Ilumatobacteraceae bacterium]